MVYVFSTATALIDLSILTFAFCVLHKRSLALYALALCPFILRAHFSCFLPMVLPHPRYCYVHDQLSLKINLPTGWHMRFKLFGASAGLAPVLL